MSEKKSEGKSRIALFGSLLAAVGTVVTYQMVKKNYVHVPGIGQDMGVVIKDMLEKAKEKRIVFSKVNDIWFAVTRDMTEDEALDMWKQLSKKKAPEEDIE